MKQKDTENFMEEMEKNTEKNESGIRNPESPEIKGL